MSPISLSKKLLYGGSGISTTFFTYSFSLDNQVAFQRALAILSISESNSKTPELSPRINKTQKPFGRTARKITKKNKRQIILVFLYCIDGKVNIRKIKKINCNN